MVPPGKSKAAIAANIRTTAMSAQIRVGRRVAWEKYQTWRTKQPQKVLDSICDVTEASESSVLEGPNGRSQYSTMYACVRCGIRRSLANIKVMPCRRRPSNLSQYKVYCMLWGAEGRNRPSRLKLEKKYAEAKARAKARPKLRKVMKVRKVVKSSAVLRLRRRPAAAE